MTPADLDQWLLMAGVGLLGAARIVLALRLLWLRRDDPTDPQVKLEGRPTGPLAGSDRAA